MATQEISGKQVLHQSLFDDFDKLTQKAESLKKSIEEIGIAGDFLAKSLSKGLGSTKKAKETTDSLANKTKELTEAEKELEKVNKQIITTSSKIEISQKDEVKLLEKKRLQLQQLNKDRKLESQLNSKQLGDIEKLNLQTRKLIAERKKLQDINGKGAVRYKELTAQISRNIEEQKRLDKQIGQSQRNVGNYPFQKLQAGFAGMAAKITGVGLAITGAIRLFKNFIGTSMDFQRQISKVGAVSNASAQEMEMLKQKALDLGKSTAFTASQVAGLELELAKLGFTATQITQMAGGILDLAAATGTDLSEAAELAGATLRIFNLQAKDSGMVADVLAKSTASSALSMSKLATALPIVGTTAKLAGLDLQRTTAMLGTLADRGIDASTAATGLRNLFLELSKKGITWEQAMNKIATATDKSKVATELFGKRSATTAIILQENAASVDDLTKKLNDAEGAAKDMADAMLDNLAGDITIAQSAWEGFILSIDSGSGVISRAARSIVQSFTQMLTNLQDFNYATDRLNSTLGEGGLALTMQKIIENSGALGQGLKLLGITSNNTTNDLAKIAIHLRNINDAVKGADPERIQAQIEAYQTDISNIGTQIIGADYDTQNVLIKQRKLYEAGLADLKKILIESEEAAAGEQLKVQEEIDKKKTEYHEKDKKRKKEMEKLLKKQLDFYDKELDEIAKLEAANNKKFREFEESLNNYHELQLADFDEIQKEQQIFHQAEMLQWEKSGIAKRDIEIENKEFAIEQAKERLAFMIQTDTFITEAQVQAVKNGISEIEIELQKAKNEASEGDALGGVLMGFSDDNFEQIKQGTEMIIDSINQILEVRRQSYEKEAEMRSQNIDDLQSEINQIEELRDEAIANGKAFDARKLNDLKVQLNNEINAKDAAQKKADEIAKKQQRLETITQAGALITASANVIQGFSKIPYVGYILGIAAAASMVAAFVAQKAEINRLSRAEKGAYVAEGGRRHSDGGNPRPEIGLETEKGEGIAVFSRKAVAKYGHSRLNEVRKSIESGTLDINYNLRRHDFKQDIETRFISNHFNDKNIVSAIDNQTGYLKRYHTEIGTQKV